MRLQKFWLFFLLSILLPIIVHSQLIDNRDLPPEMLRIKPPFVPADRASLANKDEKIYIILDNADDIIIQDFNDTETTEITLIGNVRIRFDGSFLKAEKLIITMNDSSAINVGAYGNIEFTLAGVKYLAESMNYQPDMERGVMYNVRSVLDASFGGADEKPWFFRAERVTIQSSTRFVIENVFLTMSDTRFDHFSVKANKIWYLQDKVVLAVGLEYITGQASFVWLPLFFQLEGGSGIRTSFGSEKRIGYYLINNYTLNSKIGEFDFGFDFYQLQGQFFTMNYKAPEYGFLKKLEFRFDLANDTRIIKNGDLYSQWVLPQFNKPGEYERTTQLAWYYKISTTLGTNGVSFNLDIEDLNDPFFRSKYSYRSRFDDAESINLAELLNPSLNSWFGYQGDTQPHVNTINRSFSLNADKFSMSGKWELLRVTRPDNSNQFLNKYYKYQVRSLTLPEMMYDFGSMEIASYQYSNDATVTVKDSRGKERTMSLKKLDQYTNTITQESNRSISRKITLAKNGSYLTNIATNWTPLTISNIKTNSYNWFNIKLGARAKASFKAQQTFGTNNSSTTTDINELTNTNWTTIADLYRHEEVGGINLDMRFFNNMWSVNNEIAFNYTDQWSSFADCFTNALRSSGIKVDYNIGTVLEPKKIWDDDEWFRKSIGFRTSVRFSYPLYYLFRLQKDFVKESSINWENKLLLDFMQWQRQTILGLELGFNWTQRYRVPTEDQQSIIATDPKDIYIDNVIYNRVTAQIKSKILWLGIGAEATVDILHTETNSGPFFGDNFTNRLIGGYPKLFVDFTPDSKYHYLPKLIYRYNLFEKTQSIKDPITGETRQIRTDKSFNLEFLWDIRLRNYQIPALYPFIYELSEFGFVFKYYQDFINIRNSYLSLDFAIGLKFTKYLTFKFTSRMLNNKIYLYYNGVYNGETTLSPGETSKDFWTDLSDGLKLWDQEALKRSSFKLQSLNFELIHDLDSWDMRLIFNLGRRVDSVKQIAFWEPYIGLAFTMKGSNAANIFPEFQKRFVPAEYQ